MSSLGSDRPRIVLYSDHEDSIEEDYETPDRLVSFDSLVSSSVHYHRAMSDRTVSRSPTSSSVFDRTAPVPNLFPQSSQDDGYISYEDQPVSDVTKYARTNSLVIFGVVFGVGIGIFLSTVGVSSDVTTLVLLPGTIFLRLLNCFVLPMVFVSLATGIANMVSLGKVQAIGLRTAGFFLLTVTAGAIISLTYALILRSLIPSPSLSESASVVPPMTMSLQCPDGGFLQVNQDQVIVCAPSDSNETMTLELQDSTNTLVPRTLNTITITDQITGILYALFPHNVLDSFQYDNLLSVIMFAICFGAASIRSMGSSDESNMMAVLHQLNHVFYAVISKIIQLSPIAVVSLVAGSLSELESVTNSLSKVGILVLVNLLGVLTLHLVFYPILMSTIAKRNPLSYWKMMVPCATFAFGCASSLATLPVTLRCVRSTKEISPSLYNFVVTIGCTMHMDGSAMFFPNAVVFLATTAGKHSAIGYMEIFLILLISVLGSIGAPIPNGSLVMVYSIWSTVFPSEPLPLSFSYIVAIMWYLDRVETVCNVVGDTFVARMIAEQVDETYDAA